MRGSFGGSYGLGRNSGGFNGVSKVLRTRINGLQDPFPSSSSTTSSTQNSHANNRSTTPPRTRNNSIASKHGLTISNNSNNNNHVVWDAYHPYVVPNSNVVDDNGEIDDDWECLEDYYDPIFGVVPSNLEVQHAMFSLGQFLNTSPSSQSITEGVLCDVKNDLPSLKLSATDALQRTSSTGSNQDWIEPSMQNYDQSLARSYGWEKVYDAFHLLQTEPSVQKMVVSLSSDKAVWDAVLNNETVREIRESYLNAAEASPPNNDKNYDLSDENPNVLKWIMDNMKGKLLEVVGNITQFVGGIFNTRSTEYPDQAEESLAFSEKLKTSFLLTIVVLLLVVVTRGSKA